jgi:hypothetical protein
MVTALNNGRRSPEELLSRQRLCEQITQALVR